MKKNKVFKLGLICGRFCHVQLGHNSLFDASMSLAEKTLILVSSAQESKTLRNPFKAETRIELIKAIYYDKQESQLMIREMNDLTNEYDLTTKWGEYVKLQVESHEGKFADLIVYGNEESKETWFNDEALIHTAKLIVPRSNNLISGTILRGLLLIDDKKAWEKETHPLIHNRYKQLRNELLEAPIYKKIYDMIYKDGLTIENYMNVYSHFEKEDKMEKIKKIENKNNILN